MGFQKDELKEALQMIQEGISKIESFDYCLGALADYVDKALESAPFRVGDRVALRQDIHVPKDSGWYSSRHFLTMGSRADVHNVQITDGEWICDVCFDNESYINAQGHIIPITKNKHTYRFKCAVLIKLESLRCCECGQYKQQPASDNEKGE